MYPFRAPFLDRRRYFSVPFLVAVICAVGIAATTSLGAATVLHDADELFVADARGELWKHGTEAPSRLPIGPLPAPLTGLAFDADGALYGLAADRRTWQLDPQTAEALATVVGPVAESYHYRDLAPGAAGELILLRWDEEENRSELTRLDIATGEEEALGAVLDSGSGDPFDAHSLVGVSDETFLLMGHRSIRVVDLPDLLAYDPGSADVATEYVDVDAYDLAVDAEHPRAWVLSERTGGVVGTALVPIDIFSGAVLDGVPFYTFPPGGTPRAVALRQATSPCPQDATILCLQGGRFAVGVEWQSSETTQGEGRAVAERSTSAGQFWFFEPDNREFLVKVIEGCALNGHYWVSLAGTTDVEFTLTVTDTSTGTARPYSNPPGALAETVLDIEAFPCGDGGTPQ